jgi:hypothetical protein
MLRGLGGGDGCLHPGAAGARGRRKKFTLLAFNTREHEIFVFRRRRRAGGRWFVSEHQSSASRRGLQSATNESERRAEEPPLRSVAGVAGARWRWCGGGGGGGSSDGARPTSARLETPLFLCRSALGPTHSPHATFLLPFAAF